MLSGALGSIAPAQDPLQTHLNTLIAKRQQLKTYQVKMRGVFTTHEALSTIPNTPPISSVSSVQVEIAANRAEDRYLLIAQSEPAIPSFNYCGQLPDAPSRVFLIDGDNVLRMFNGQFQKGQSIHVVSYPDPLTLGLGFCAETGHFVRFTSASDNLKLWTSEGRDTDLRGPVVSYKDRSTHITFDTSRDCIVTSIGFNNGPQSGSNVLGEVEPIQVNGHWLPKRVSYQCGSSFFTWELDWVSVNAPLPDELFDASTVEAMARSTK